MWTISKKSRRTKYRHTPSHLHSTVACLVFDVKQVVTSIVTPPLDSYFTEPLQSLLGEGSNSYLISSCVGSIFEGIEVSFRVVRNKSFDALQKPITVFLVEYLYIRANNPLIIDGFRL